MKKAEFIDLLEEYLDNTGMTSGCYNAFFSVGDADNVNTTIYIDKDNYIWITDNESVKRIKTSINVDNIIEIRYSQFGSDGGRFFVVCQDDTGLDSAKVRSAFSQKAIMVALRRLLIGSQKTLYRDYYVFGD